MAENSPAITVQHVYKAYGTRPVLVDVSFSAYSGRILALVGPSGVGKTTLLRLLAGLELPDKGDIILAKHSETLPLGPLVSFVFQEAVVFPPLTVEENLLLNPHPSQDLLSDLDSVLRLIRLEGRSKEMVAHLSGGERKRLSIGRALISPRPILLMDEPLSEVDFHLAEEIRFHLRRLVKERHVCCLYVTHNPFEALSFTDEIGLLDGTCMWHFSDPHSAYFRPPSLEAAHLLGPCMALPVRITALDGNRLHLVNNGTHFAIPALNASMSQRSSGGVLLIRPQAGMITAQDAPAIEDSIILNGRLLSRTWLPSGSLGEVALEEIRATVTLRIAPDYDPAIGNRVKAFLDAGLLSFLGNPNT